MRTNFVAVVICSLVPLFAQATQPQKMSVVHAVIDPAPLGVEGCVDLALANSPKLQEVEAKVQGLAARLAEVESVYYPKLSALAFVAPMYTVRGSGFERHRETRYKSIRDWGPYVNLEVRLTQPLYTFGRVAAGKAAWAARREVEQARLREAQHAIALEVRRLYYMRLFPMSLLPALKKGEAILTAAQAAAEAAHEAGVGEVTQVDLARLKNGFAELKKAQIQAEHASELLLAALKHTMGLPDVAVVEQAEKTLPRLGDTSLAPLPELLVEAAESRPEWAQLAAGRRASLKWEQAEKLAVWPTLALAGAFAGAKTPTRSADENPWHHDAYNRLMGGLALALHFDTDVALARAKARTARAQGDELVALERFAATGIPLEVRRAYDDLLRLTQTAKESEQQVVATRRWMTFAGTAYQTGAGDARDLLEGLAAHMQARRGHLETIQQYYAAKAGLTYAVGRLR